MYVNNNPGKTIVTGNSTSTFYDSVSNNPGAEFRVSTGSTAVFLGPVTGSGGFTGAGVKDFEAGATPGALATPGSTIVGVDGTLTTPYIRETSLSIEGVASISLRAGGGDTSRLNALNITGGTNAWSGALDLNDTAMVIDYVSGSSPLATVQNQLKSGYASGAWTGKGIRSGAAAASATGLTHRTALGVAEASDLFSTFPATFAGQSVDNSSVLIRYVTAGDANLDGSVDTVDFGLLAGHFGAASGERWFHGDFNYDGSVDTIDFGLLASNFGYTLPASVGPGVLVPEPGAVLLVALAIPFAIRRRHARSG